MRREVKVLLVCPVPAEYNACREVLRMRESCPVGASRSARAVVGGIEFTSVESGPAKARAAAATAYACQQYQPDLVVDTGSCAGLGPGAEVGQVVLATETYEYDIGGGAIPTKSLPAMRLPGALALLGETLAGELVREAAVVGAEGAVVVRVGPQACGELLVQSSDFRLTLHSLFQAIGANWESAGVFVAALRGGRPVLSTRVVTDLGDEQALEDFRRHVRGCGRQLYGHIRDLAEAGWFGRFMQLWGSLDPDRRGGLPASVWP
jgi:adenosylhomocysteine nucleosidase